MRRSIKTLIEKARGPHVGRPRVPAAPRKEDVASLPKEGCFQGTHAGTLAVCAEHRLDPGTVYFVESAGFIKIGFTTGQNAAKRLDTFDTASPLSVRVLALIPGSLKLERRLHEVFKEQRHKREWFRGGGALQEFVGVLRGTVVHRSREGREAAYREIREIRNELCIGPAHRRKYKERTSEYALDELRHEMESVNILQALV